LGSEQSGDDSDSFLNADSSFLDNSSDKEDDGASECSREKNGCHSGREMTSSQLEEVDFSYNSSHLGFSPSKAKGVHSDASPADGGTVFPEAAKPGLIIRGKRLPPSPEQNGNPIREGIYELSDSSPKSAKGKSESLEHVEENVQSDLAQRFSIVRNQSNDAERHDGPLKEVDIAGLAKRK